MATPSSLFPFADAREPFASLRVLLEKIFILTA
jgi:hypothetical protein